MRTGVFVIVCLSLAGGSLACGSGEIENGPMTMEQARGFDEFALYWLGSSYEGVPVTQITRFQYDGAHGGTPENVVLVDYGAGSLAGNGAGILRYNIRIEPYCDQPAASAVTEGGPDIDVRGALARQVEDETIRVWTGDAAVSVSSSQDVDAARLAALDLLSISHDGGGALQLLPTPRSQPC